MEARHHGTAGHGAAARWVKVEFTVTLGAASTLRRGFVYVPPANETPQHDLDGNLIEDGQWVYTWDAENRMKSATQKVLPVAAGVSTPPARLRLEFAHDYLGRRIAKRVYVAESGTPVVWRLTKDLRFVYDGWHMIAELDATFATGTGVAGITPAPGRGVVRTYLWGPDVSGTMTGAGGVGGLLAFTFQGDTYYPISDANGNITAIHAPGIDRVARFDYDPFGNRITNTGPDVELCPFGFSTKYTDAETGLVDYMFRYYSPQMGRFISRDPIEENGGVNLYGFVGNDAVNRWDYLGLLSARFASAPIEHILGSNLSLNEIAQNRANFNIAVDRARKLGLAVLFIQIRYGYELEKFAQDQSICEKGRMALASALKNLANVAKTIDSWKSETVDVIYTSYGTAVIEANAFTVPSIAPRTIWIGERIIEPGTYLHELSHLTRYAPYDTITGTEATPFASTQSGPFYNAIGNLRSIKDTLRLQLVGFPLRRVYGISETGHNEWRRIEECCGFNKLFQ